MTPSIIVFKDLIEGTGRSFLEVGLVRTDAVTELSVKIENNGGTVLGSESLEYVDSEENVEKVAAVLFAMSDVSDEFRVVLKDFFRGAVRLGISLGRKYEKGEIDLSDVVEL